MASNTSQALPQTPRGMLLPVHLSMLLPVRGSMLSLISIPLMKGRKLKLKAEIRKQLIMFLVASARSRRFQHRQVSTCSAPPQRQAARSPTPAARPYIRSLTVAQSVPMYPYTLSCEALPRVTRYPISIWEMTILILSSPISLARIAYRYPGSLPYRYGR